MGLTPTNPSLYGYCLVPPGPHRGDYFGGRRCSCTSPDSNVELRWFALYVILWTFSRTCVTMYRLGSALQPDAHSVTAIPTGFPYPSRRAPIKKCELNAHPVTATLAGFLFCRDVHRLGSALQRNAHPVTVTLTGFHSRGVRRLGSALQHNAHPVTAPLAMIAPLTTFERCQSRYGDYLRNKSHPPHI